nr:hypothetical protein CFP56_54395 [Quercus suber]POE66136.1 hypothetical protein CFP56_54398 [Quercus suber]
MPADRALTTSADKSHEQVSYDAQFESMDVPEHVRALRKEILDREGGRQDDVEFTFVKGRWNHLGEATLANRVKSHPDVGVRWYPELLRQIREQQAAVGAERKTDDAVRDNVQRETPQQHPQSIEAH